MGRSWRLLCAAVLATCLFCSCSQEDEEEDSAKHEKKSRPTTRLPRISDRDSQAVVPNRYAEKRWDRRDGEENEWTNEFRRAETPEEKMAVLELKQSSGPEMLAPVVRLALRHPDDRVREQAARTIHAFAGVYGGERQELVGGGPGSIGRGGGPGRADAPDPTDDTGAGGSDEEAVGEEDVQSVQEAVREVVDLVVGAVHDPSYEVRALAMEAALELHPDVQLEIYEETIAVPDGEVRRKTITELGRMMTKPAFEVLVGGLRHPDPEFREQVNGEIRLIVHRTFDSFDEAQGWWQTNAEGFTGNMLDIGGSR